MARPGNNYLPLLAAPGLYGLFPKNKYEHTDHPTENDVTRVGPNRKAIPYASHKGEKAHEQNPPASKKEHPSIFQGISYKDYKEYPDQSKYRHA